MRKTELVFKFNPNFYGKLREMHSRGRSNQLKKCKIIRQVMPVTWQKYSLSS